jgi:hypothetical protein
MRELQIAKGLVGTERYPIRARASHSQGPELPRESSLTQHLESRLDDR